MSGLIGLGIGLALGWASINSSSSTPILPWLLWAVSYLLVYLWGRRARRHSSTSQAVAVAVAKAEATSSAQSAVNVFVNTGSAPADVMGDRLRATTWYGIGDVDQAHELDRAAQSAIAEGADPDEIDGLDQVDLIERVRRGESAIGT